MNEIVRNSTVGNVSQNADCVVQILPSDDGIQIELNSIVKNQFMDAIENTVYDELSKHGVSSAIVKIEDRGAIDPVLRARLEYAIKRAMEV